jgi:hypothetical protein
MKQAQLSAAQLIILHARAGKPSDALQLAQYGWPSWFAHSRFLAPFSFARVRKAIRCFNRAAGQAIQVP